MSEETDYIVLTVPEGTEAAVRVVNALRSSGYAVKLEETDSGHFEVTEVASSSKMEGIGVATASDASQIIAKELQRPV